MKHSWRPSGVVTWTTDFGLRDAYVGTMKGVALGVEPGLRLVDLTHDVPPQDVRAASFHLAHAWSYFPAGTVHVAVVDPGVGSDRAILVARDRGHVFVAPDNGLLGPVLGPEAQVASLDVERFALPARSATFHGRDVFAPAAARIAAGLDPAAAGTPHPGWLDSGPFPRAVREGDVVRGEILIADRFGNLVTTVRPEDLAGDLAGDPTGDPGSDPAALAGRWVAEAAGRELPLGRTYAVVGSGEALALVDSLGWLELAVRDGDAARSLGLRPGDPVCFRRVP